MVSEHAIEVIVGRNFQFLFSSTSACLLGFWYSLGFLTMEKNSNWMFIIIKYFFFENDICHSIHYNYFTLVLCLNYFMLILIHTFQCLYNESFYKTASLLLSSLTWFIAQLHNIFQERYLTGVFWTDTYLGMSFYCFKSRTTTCWVLKSCFPHFPPLRGFLIQSARSLGSAPFLFLCQKVLYA